MKKRMNKLDLILIVGMGVIALLSSLIDAFYIKYFPVCSIMSIYASYALWLILLIYSLLKYKENQDKPQYVRWFMGLILPFLHIVFIIFGFIICILLMKLLNL